MVTSWITRLARVGAAGAVGVAAVAMGGGPSAGQADDTCRAPYVPSVVSQRGQSYRGKIRQIWPSQAVAVPDWEGSVSLGLDDRWADRPIDTDGDGVGDLVGIDVGTASQDLVIARADGEIRVAGPGVSMALANERVGDLDGDGRDEVVFLTRDNETGTDRLFVLPGVTEPGTHAPDEVGIELVASRVLAAGDQGGAPGTDLVMIPPLRDLTGPPDTVVVSGAALMASGPGTVGAVDVLATIAGVPMLVADLGEARPSIISMIVGDGATLGDWTGVEEIVVQREGGPVRFAVNHQSWDGGGQDGPSYSAVSVSRLDQGTFLSLGGSNRGGSMTALWNLDDPCAALEPVTGSTTPVPPPGGSTAPPAAPRPGTPSITG